MSEEEMKKAVFQKIDDLSPEQLKIVDEFTNERAELLKKLAQ
ncbi:MAG: hypothetical protein ABIN57_06535 [Chitinophagaceae bacterium]